MPLPPWAQRIVTWSGHAEARLTAAGRFAVLIAMGLPVYALAVWLVIGAKAWAVLPVFASLPLLLAVPPIGRRRPQAGRWLALAAPLAATSLAVLALGSVTRAGLFYLPVLALVPLIFPAGQRRNSALAALACALLTLVAAAILGRGLEPFTPQEIYGLAKLHAAGAVALLIAVAFVARHQAMGTESRVVTKEEPPQDLPKGDQQIDPKRVRKSKTPSKSKA